MGRRIVAAAFDPVKEYRQASQALRTVMQQIDIGQFQAQLHAADMVELLAGFARDPSLATEFRRQCAIDVLNRAGGVPGERIEAGAPDPQARMPGGEGQTVGQEIEAVRASATAFLMLERWMAVPPEHWPAEVHAAMGAAAYAADSPLGAVPAAAVAQPGQHQG